MLKASEEFVVGKHDIAYVTSDFKKYFNDAQFELKTSPTFQKLPRSMNDIEIASELKPGICDLGDVLAFMYNPPEGTKDGNWNLFYTKDFVVGVGWGEDAWRVGAWGRGDGGWYGDVRVFSPATVSSNPCTHCTLETRILELEKFKANVEKVLKLG